MRPSAGSRVRRLRPSGQHEAGNGEGGQASEDLKPRKRPCRVELIFIVLLMPLWFSDCGSDPTLYL